MEGRPNFLFLLPDQFRADWFRGHEGLSIQTPHLEALAQGGTNFTQAFTPSPLCSPARACLATGLDYPLSGVINNGQNTPIHLPNFYRRLRESGYQVGGVGKFDLHKPDLDWGSDGSALMEEYGFSCGCDNEGKGDAIQSTRKNGGEPVGPYMHWLKSKGLLDTHMKMYEGRKGLSWPAISALPDEAYCDNWITDKGLETLENFSPDSPWHLVVNFTGPHDPFDVTEKMAQRAEEITTPEPVQPAPCDEEKTPLCRKYYAAMIENMDTQIGRLIQKVKDRGDWENTVVIFSSDHGEMLGDHGRWGKSVWHHPSTRIPLIVSGPGLPKGARQDALVALHDIGPTLLELAGEPPLPETDALSLMPLLRGDKGHLRDVVCSGLNGWRMVFDGRFKLVVGSEDALKLTDLENDPHETMDVSEQYPDVVQRLSEWLPDNS